MFCFSQLNSTYTRTNTPLPATVCQTPAAPTRRLTAELDWITLWIFSRSWVNTLANMWFINMPGATPSSVRQRLISYSNTERRFPEFQLRSSGNQPGGKKKKISCAANHILTLLSFGSWVNDHHLSLVPGPDCFYLSSPFSLWLIYYLTWLVPQYTSFEVRATLTFTCFLLKSRFRV